MNKMKKTVRFICALLLGLTTVSAVACKQEKTGDVETKLQYRTINTFDEYDDVFAYSWSTNFGRAAVNKNPDFISEGTGSMLVQARGFWTDQNVYPGVTYDCYNSFFIFIRRIII